MALLQTQHSMHDRAVKALSQLPPFSPTLNKLLATLAKEDVSFAELGGVVEKDTVLAGHVLKIVNSALYAHSGTVNSVRHAVSILGVNKLRNTALSLSVSRMWSQVKTPKEFSMAEFNLHSIATAILADLLAMELPVHYPEGAFTAGLLHGLGKLLIAIGLPSEYASIFRASKAGKPVRQLERDLLGFSHAQLAAEALAQWKLPLPIQKGAGFQDDPEPTVDGVLMLSGLLHLSHRMVNALEVRIPACALDEPRSPEELLASVGLKDISQRILDDFEAEFGSLKGFF